LIFRQPPLRRLFSYFTPSRRRFKGQVGRQASHLEIFSPSVPFFALLYRQTVLTIKAILRPAPLFRRGCRNARRSPQRSTPRERRRRFCHFARNRSTARSKFHSVAAVKRRSPPRKIADARRSVERQASKRKTPDAPPSFRPELDAPFKRQRSIRKAFLNDARKRPSTPKRETETKPFYPPRLAPLSLFDVKKALGSAAVKKRRFDFR
jgi:hypothetical protein